MTIEVGQKLPEGKLAECHEFDSDTGCPLSPQPVEVSALTNGKKVVIFAVPGAFTPLCSAQHLPGFIKHADAIKAAGADEICCLAVNDAFVMAAWGKHLGVNGKVRMLADGSAEFVKAMGLDRDLTGGGMGVRAFRFAMIVDNGVVKYLGVEGSGEFGKSSAETILDELKR
ncbi:MAG: peroxiredoxin [Methylophaga sp.]|nr:peroxiredoxin [Methylophaga sp.]